MELRWLTAALADLRAIKDYISEENPVAAQRVNGLINRHKFTIVNATYFPLSFSQSI